MVLKDFSSAKFRVSEKKDADLKKMPAGIEAFYSDEKDYNNLLAQMQSQMLDLQSIISAENRRAVLIIFQGMDTAGKDSAIKHVMSGLNPAAVAVTAFGRPSDEELRHDFLWRTHRWIPASGRIGIFNRSYYEEVTTVRVHPELLDHERLTGEPSKRRTKKLTSELFQSRIKDIVQHESYLARQNIQIIKIFLHVSKKESRQRLLARIETPSKRWKIEESDIKERKFWNDYAKAYEVCLASTSNEKAPWYIVPADDKKNARLIISKILLEHFKAMDPQYPTVSKKKQAELKRFKNELR